MSGGAPEQEIRFAVVLYGGASLAIYINGIAQELLRMVRSTAPEAGKLTGTELVYRKIAVLLSLDHIPGNTLLEENESAATKARFVVDIVSGTSAGGINGVALAKSLALKCPNMDSLERTWLEKAQIDDLLNNKSFGKTDSLLKSGYMYDVIYDALSAMNTNAGPAPAQDADPSASPGFADQIDLFVTTTDLNGLYEPIQLADGAVDERVHRAVFQFSYESPQYAKLQGGAAAKNDFGAEYDPMLAFAARCTSSFPLAFEPMQFDSIGEQIGRTERSRKKSKEKFERFFPEYQAQGKGFFAEDFPLGTRQFADGGYLDNRPFSYAIDLIQYRSSFIPVQRKLLFVDPFPEYREDHKTPQTFDFVQNSMLGLVTLPHYETIRNDIDRVNDNNRRQDRLAVLHDELGKYAVEARSAAKGDAGGEARPGNLPAAPQLSDEDLRRTPVRELISLYKYSDSYRAYHVLRRMTATADLAAALTDGLGFRPDGDEAYFIRLLLRAWREANYSDQGPGNAQSAAAGGAAGKLENAFLLDFDIEYERRRINDLITLIDRYLSWKPIPKRAIPLENELLVGMPDGDIKGLRDFLTRQLMALTTARAAGLRNAADGAAVLLKELGDSFGRIMSARDRETRYDIARGIYKDKKQAIDPVMAAIKGPYAEVLARVRLETGQKLAAPLYEKLLLRYQTFQWRDSISLPFLDGTDSKEHTKIEVYRVSPADTALYPNSVERPDKKLAGTAVGAFGAFLQESWRQNDIMWGRLDGAERIIAALLPDAADEKSRREFTNEAQDQILFETLGTNDNGMLFRWLVQRLTKETFHQKTAAEIEDYARKFFPKSGAIIKKGEFADFIRKNYEVPQPPVPEKVIGWVHDSLSILGRMIDSLRSGESDKPQIVSALTGRLGVALRMAGLLLSQVLAFAVPERIGYHLLRRWLSLVALAGALLVVAATVFDVPTIQTVGVIVMLACFVVWLAQQAFVRFLRPDGGGGWFATILFLLFVVAVPWAAGVYFAYLCLASSLQANTHALLSGKTGSIFAKTGAAAAILLALVVVLPWLYLSLRWLYLKLRERYLWMRKRIATHPPNA